MATTLAATFCVAVQVLSAFATPLPNQTNNAESEMDEIIRTKHEYFRNCMQTDVEPEYFVLYPNGTAYVEVLNATFNSSFNYIINGTLFICSDFLYGGEAKPTNPSKFTNIHAYATYVGLGTSMICLLLHLVVFGIVRDIRNLPGYNLASLCLSLLLGYFCLIAGNGIFEANPGATCVAFASLTQLFFLVSFMWTSVMAIDVFRSLLNATGKLRLTSTHFSIKKFALYSCYAWGIPLAITVLTLIADHLSFISDGYRPRFGQGDFCWFKTRIPLMIYFAAPVFVIIGCNVILFGMSAFVIFNNTMKTNDESQRTAVRNNFKMYSRLAVIMGVTWAVSFLHQSTEEPWLHYLFILLNTFQGLFIFIFFTCATKVRSYFKSILRPDDRKASVLTLSPTFQSYCSYANSIETDLDNLSQNGTEKRS